MGREVDPEFISEDNPEWTDEDFAKARPAKEVLPELFGKQMAAEMLKPKASGDGWQTRINDALRALFIGR